MSLRGEMVPFLLRACPKLKSLGHGGSIPYGLELLAEYQVINTNHIGVKYILIGGRGGGILSHVFILPYLLVKNQFFSGVMVRTRALFTKSCPPPQYDKGLNIVIHIIHKI